MENSVIAIQIADGTFVPILNTANKSRRRLVVTTVRDGQTSVQIELFRASDESLGDPQYVGSLMIQNISGASAGQPDVTVLLGVDDDGNLNATATDDSSGAYESLSISLERLGADEQMTDADFDLPDGEIGAPDPDSDDLSLDDLSFDPLPPADLEPSDDDDPFASIGDGDEDDLVLEDIDDDDVFGVSDADETTTDDELEAALAEMDAGLDGDSLPADDDVFADFDRHADDDEPPTESISLDDDVDILAGAGDETLDALLDDSEDELDSLTLEDDQEDDQDDDESFSVLDEVDEDEDAEAAEDDASTPAGEPPIEGFSDDDFGFDDSFSLDDDDDGAAGADGPADEPAAGAAADDSFGMDDDFSISELTEEEADAPQESAFGDDISFDDETLDDLSFDDDSTFSEAASAVDDGAAEEIADLGDEDFSFDEDVDDSPGIDAAAAEDLSPEEFSRLDAAPARDEEPFADEESLDADEPLAPRRSNGIIFAGYMILALAALGVLSYLVFRLLEGPPAPPLRGVFGGLRAVATMVPLWLGPLSKGS